MHARLRRATRIADAGCGFGRSAIGLARAYPGAAVDGFDIDEPSVVAARRNAEQCGVADRVRFHVVDGAGIDGAGIDGAGTGGTHESRPGAYDAVFGFECVHDMSDPVSVLATMRTMAADDGVVVVMDERTEDTFTAPAGEVEQLYGYSLMCYRLHR